MAPGDDNESMKQRELHGWKEVSDHLGRSVRTAQRWEREFGLPVRRLRTAAGETVYALVSELDEWKAAVTRKGTADGFEEAEPGDSAPGEKPGLEPNDGPAAEPTPAPGDGAVAGGASNVAVPPARGRRRWPLVAGASIVLAIAGSLALWASHYDRSASAARTVPASSVLDPGPWPTTGHDMQRTNRSDLPGPAQPGGPRLLYELQEADGQLYAVITTMDGHILLGSCGRVIALDRSGREAWTREVRSVSGVREQPAGFSAGSAGAIYFTAFDCPDQNDLIQTHLYEISSTGEMGKSLPIGSSYNAPAIGPDRVVYTIDEVNFLRRFQPSMTAAGGTTLAGFTSGGIAVDARGNLYVGTNGSETHQSSFWSLTPEGDVRWNTLKEALGQAVVGDDRVFVASLSGNVYRFSLDGQQVWSTNVGPIGSLKPLALGRSGRIYVQTAKDLVSLTPDGNISWRQGNGASVSRSHPVVDRDENVYAVLADEVLSFTSDGRERWRVPVAGRPLQLILGETRVLYVTTADRKLYAIGEK